MSRILLISGNIPLMAKMMTAATEAGFTAKNIDHESDLVHADVNLRKESYSVVVIELSLTGSCTFELEFIQRIKRLQPRCRVIGVVHKMSEGVEDMLRAGGDDFVYSGWKFINWPVLLELRIGLWKKIAEYRPEAKRRIAASA